MIFSPKIYLPKNIVNLILNGEKTQTRRAVKKGEEFRNWDSSTIGGKHQKFIVQSKNNYRVKWKTGKNYCVQLGRGKGRIGLCDCGKPFTIKEKRCHAGWKPIYIIITNLKQELLKEISKKDIKKEGFESKEKYFEAYFKANNISKKKQLTHNPKVWVIDFKVKK